MAASDWALNTTAIGASTTAARTRLSRSGGIAAIGDDGAAAGLESGVLRPTLQKIGSSPRWLAQCAAMRVGSG